MSLEAVAENPLTSTWLNGRWLANSSLPPMLTGVSSSGCDLGVIEHVPVSRRANGEWCLFRLHDHLRRLYRTAARIGLSADAPYEMLESATLAWLQQMNALSLAPGLNLRGDSTSSAGLEIAEVRLYLTLKICCTETPSWSGLSTDSLLGGVASVACTRVPKAINLAVDVCFSPELRSGTHGSLGNVLGNRAISWLAHTAARRSGHFSALQQDGQGRVLGAAFCNLFAVYAHKVVTPTLASGAFGGLTRASVLTLAEESGYKVRQQDVSREMLFDADEVFLTSSVAELLSVRRIDGVLIGNGDLGSVAQRLSARYADILRGTDLNHPEWLHFA